MKNPTNQEFFDATVRALHAQGRRSVDESDECLYRGPDGLKCAAGIHITDEQYDVAMETKTIVAVIRDWPEVADHFPPATIYAPYLPEWLQGFHDSYINWNPEGGFSITGFKKLRDIAQTFNLDQAVIEAINGH